MSLKIEHIIIHSIIYIYHRKYTSIYDDECLIFIVNIYYLSAKISFFVDGLSSKIYNQKYGKRMFIVFRFYVQIVWLFLCLLFFFPLFLSTRCLLEVYTCLEKMSIKFFDFNYERNSRCQNLQHILAKYSGQACTIVLTCHPSISVVTK